MTAVMPKWVVRAETGGVLSIEATERRLQRRYYIKKERFMSPFGRELPPLLNDLVDLASTVYAADRIIRRRELAERRGWSWQRRIEMQIPVSDPERWSEATVSSLLSEALGFLTEDFWEFRFLPSGKRSDSRGLQHVLFPPEPPISSALFSGGLDSLAGVGLQLTDGSLRNLVVLTCATNSRLLRKQRQLLESLRARTTTQLLPIILPVRLSQHRSDYNFNERSQRGRGFLFTMLGSVAAIMAGAGELNVYENGVGAINLPLSEAQLGAQSSRATHPVALRKLERFLQALLGFEFHLRLPYLFWTKGEICERFAASRFKDLAVRSVSCDGFPPRISGPEQCGVCTSCLLRRQALFSAGFVEDRAPRQYRYDVFGSPEHIPAEELAPWWDMLSQVDKLGRALSSRDPWRNLTVEYSELLEVLEVVADWLGPSAKSHIQQRIITMYWTYCQEWQRLPSYPVGWNFSTPDLRLTA